MTLRQENIPGLVLHWMNKARLVHHEIISSPPDQALTNAAKPSSPPETRDARPERITTIDILRALTMVLMIFVNDLWSLTNIPAWLGHVEAGVDGIGLADVVFPAFLFIVGLSIPYAFESRRKRGDEDRDLVVHVLWRTVALLVMGVFLVNGETINAAATGIPRYVWGPLCALCFILIWNRYPKEKNRLLIYAIRAVAIAVLCTLAIIYRGGGNDALISFGPQWWGILGLIGWAYLVSALVAIAAKENMYVVIGAWTFFSVLSIVWHAGLYPDMLRFIPPAISGGTMVALTLGGILTAMIFRHFRARNDNKSLTLALLAFSVLLIALYAITRPYWGLSKLAASPAWLFLCSAFTILAFLVIYWIADVYKRDSWFDIVKPAGTATLLCYLIPHFAYFFTRLLGIELPDVLLAGGIGLLKSFLFALLCVAVTGGLIKMGITMRI